MVRRSGFIAIALTATLLCAGCGAGTGAKPPVAGGRLPDSSSLNTDPCATRLHEICGPLLMYYATSHRLPDSLDDLRKTPGFDAGIEFTCPLSKRPYVYNPAGLPLSASAARLVLYDPAPSHAGMRWAVSVIEPQDGSALILKVIAVPESRFASRRAE